MSSPKLLLQVLHGIRGGGGIMPGNGETFLSFFSTGFQKTHSEYSETQRNTAKHSESLCGILKARKKK
jgi:hypothetical protein